MSIKSSEMSRNKGKGEGYRNRTVEKIETHRKLKKRGRLITVDLDGTVADISKRRQFALGFGEEKSPSFYQALLDPSHFHLDEPIIGARDFLTAYVSQTGGEVRYLSGRRIGTEASSLSWLVSNGFPSGEVIHRKTGIKSLDFKKHCLIKLASEFRIEGHFGDREIDDRLSAESAGIRYFHIANYVWPDFSDVRSFFIKDVSTDYIDLE